MRVVQRQFFYFAKSQQARTLQLHKRWRPHNHSLHNCHYSGDTMNCQKSVDLLSVFIYVSTSITGAERSRKAETVQMPLVYFLIWFQRRAAASPGCGAWPGTAVYLQVLHTTVQIEFKCGQTCFCGTSWKEHEKQRQIVETRLTGWNGVNLWSGIHPG